MVQVAVISGASTGIGRASALALAARGVRVLAGVRSDEDAASLRQEHPLVEPVRLDVTDAEQRSAVAAAAERALGAGDRLGLVNNAGIALAGPVEFVALEDFRRQFEVNVFGHVGMIQALMPLLRRNAGRIVNVTSIGGVVSQPLLSPYAGSKHAFEAVSDALRMELRPWRIGVSMIEPGSVATPIWEKGIRAGREAAGRLPTAATQLYGRAIEAGERTAQREARRGAPPDRVARAVCHALLSERPRTRYRVGIDAHALWALKRLLPDRAFDELILRVAGLPH